MKHILIVGPPHIGKSTLLHRLLAHTERPVCGFITKGLPRDERGFHSIYIHPAARAEGERIYTPENLIGTCDRRSHTRNPAAFETFGLDYLSRLPENGLIVMDELGFMETSSPTFMARVLELLEGDIPILAAVKDRADIDFLTRIRNHPKALAVTLNAENQEVLYEQLLPLMAP